MDDSNDERASDSDGGTVIYETISDSDSDPNNKVIFVGEKSTIAERSKCGTCDTCTAEQFANGSGMENPVPEEIAITDDRLKLFNEGETIPDEDRIPLNKVTQFSVLDDKGNLCPFDTGLIESGKKLYFSGYIKPIYDEDPKPFNALLVKEMGPIEEWWISGFDGGDSFVIGLTSPYADYILMEPSVEYSPFMRAPKQKALLTKIVIEFLGTSENPTYENLLTRIKEVTVPEDIEPFEENCLEKHARFLMNQVQDVDDGKQMLSTPAAQEIIRRFNVDLRTRTTKKKERSKVSTFEPITTRLVRKAFNFFFSCRASAEDPSPAKRPRVSTSTTCSPPSSPSSKSSKSSKSSESSESSEPIEPIEPVESIESTESSDESSDSSKSPQLTKKKRVAKTLGEIIWERGRGDSAVNSEVVPVHNYVTLNTGVKKANRIYRIEYSFQANYTKKVHCAELIKGTDTILKDASHPREYFFTESCGDWPINRISSKVKVRHLTPPQYWNQFLRYSVPFPRKGFFVQKLYSQRCATFEDYPQETFGICSICKRRDALRRKDTPMPMEGTGQEPGVVSYKKIIWNNEEYNRGHCVMIEPFAVDFDYQKSASKIRRTVVTEERDEETYPEYYRKGEEVITMEGGSEPYTIGSIRNIFTRREGNQSRLFISINKFYRPENTRIKDALGRRKFDFQLLFWSDEEVDVPFEHVRGLCSVFFSELPPPVAAHPQFYFTQAFDAKTGAFTRANPQQLILAKRIPHPVSTLKTLNVFSGCGGLAEGLRQSQFINICWAVEADEATCNSFRANFPKAIVYKMDCNQFLKEIISPKVGIEEELKYPQKGEVECIVGGPPCQGFSTMNRYSGKDDLQYNNSLLLTFLSICDYYRPKYILLENVRNFLYFKQSRFFRHTIASLLIMGYQCTFGVIQSGNYGVPQKRSRIIIMAAAPGFSLPNIPQPTHVFNDCQKNFEYDLNGSTYYCRTVNQFTGSAPYRQMTIWDAISDLPEFAETSRAGFKREEKDYLRFLGGRPREIPDHASKIMSLLNEARIKNIPAGKSRDWRDLPNTRVCLQDLYFTDLLKYNYYDRKKGNAQNGMKRGVCPCSSGQPCDPAARQNNTLIPWFLVHTATKNNNWRGLYGRLEWDKVFGTITTNPEPSSQQGRVLHPEEDRVLSVRECARAQGLPDGHILFGTLTEKYKQVGNAVPSPVARAFGYEIGRSMYADNDKDMFHCEFFP